MTIETLQLTIDLASKKALAGESCDVRSWMGYRAINRIAKSTWSITFPKVERKSMQFIIANTNNTFRLQVFNRGFKIAVHFSSDKNYIKRKISEYESRMIENPDHAAHGHPVQVIWA